MMYSFEGNVTRRPEQNLSGASSKKDTRDVLLKRAHLERQKREVFKINHKEEVMFRKCDFVTGTKKKIK